MTRADKVLIWLLRIIGGAAVLAVIPVVMPASWMAAVHAGLGMGALPNAPIVDYLARSLSAFYAMFGAVFVFVSLDLDRYRPLIRLLAWLLCGFSVVLLGVDIAAGMPWWWTVSEGPPGVLVSLWMVRLARSGTSMLKRCKAWPQHDGASS
jgi:hypothetical protein